MRRVVITGLGIVSSIGNSAQEVLGSLREGKSGISAAPDYAEHGFRCQVHGAPQIDLAEAVGEAGAGAEAVPAQEGAEQGAGSSSRDK